MLGRERSGDVEEDVSEDSCLEEPPRWAARAARGTNFEEWKAHVESNAAKAAQENATFASFIQSSQCPAWPSELNLEPNDCKVLGSGTYSKVYKVKVKGKTDGWRAVKVQSRSADSKAEIQFTRKFSDPGFSKLSHRFPFFFNAAQGKGSQGEAIDYMLTEWAQGGDFGKNINHDDKTRLFQEIVEGVDEMHKQSVAHRDLKPGNILISMRCGKGQSPCAKIGDLGFACFQKDNRIQNHHGLQTCDSDILGTPGYMAPESCGQQKQFSGDRFAMDIWALGIILYETVFGTMPSQIRAALPNPEKIYKATSKFDISEDAGYKRYVSEGGTYASLLRCMLKQNPSDRCPTAKILAWLKVHQPGQQTQKQVQQHPEQQKQHGYQAPMPFRKDVAPPLAPRRMVRDMRGNLRPAAGGFDFS